MKIRNILPRVKRKLFELPYDFFWYLKSSIKSLICYQSPYDKKTEKLSDIHSGKKAILLGNGPSVSYEDLEKFNGYIIFACNRIHLAYENTTFRPDYVLTSDEQVISDFSQNITENNKGIAKTVFVSKKSNSLSDFWFMLKKGTPFKFRVKINQGLQSGGGTLISACQLGYFMGIKEFYLYGVDHSFKFELQSKGTSGAMGEGNHFLKNYRAGKSWQAPTMDVVEDAFKKSDEFLRQNGGFIKNATRGGKLEVLERIDLHEMV
ncbi:MULTISPECIES: 6-hydroxymethylpterin diphosphokinase MptE-like protein [unclassified Colwellia]|uniref:6-hydroxymethylpterin diphosphokinase MptE-like protein n=1 Tax=unclassified Colwellia TaxID=196834 RepID=UPI0015F36348|nr:MULTISPECIES: 6-hydroxymethylpterin diphosphokinase MptE-like protein [unclassified Colwellia]MBA6233499.1 DUF115 domain-containing protein [Colwellia sp. MB02u-7]MBA6236589.1 DUF115 domain-containing protein [Colwellia sp. MB02u-11]MBA6298012.1 DUF115 domain-containing protein [Colwellia sp. MB3u-22]MBA6312164.1 DUF115 domain-containing protein [Colwellia sp. MB3u-64]